MQTLISKLFRISATHDAKIPSTSSPGILIKSTASIKNCSTVSPTEVLSIAFVKYKGAPELVLNNDE